MGEPFTREMMESAIRLLEEKNVGGDEYVFYVHPIRVIRLTLWTLIDTKVYSYREELTAHALLEYELRRKRHGRRKEYPTAIEVLQRAVKLSYDKNVSVIGGMP